MYVRIKLTAKAVSQEKSRLTAFCVRFGHNVVLTITHLREILTVKQAERFWIF